MNLKKLSLATFFLFGISACGGGGGSQSGMLLTGTVTEAGGAHARIGRHSEGQRIEGVNVCALGLCSETDSEGQWGFVAPPEFNGGPTLFSLRGHGIDTQSAIEIPDGANEVELDLRHVAGGLVVASHIVADGIEDHSHDGEEHGHAH